MNKKVTSSLSIFLLLILVSSAMVSPLAAQIAIAQLPIDPSTATLLVESSDVSGNSFSGMWVELWQNDVIIQEGFTPFSSEVGSGVTYEVFMDNWQDVTFDHWEDGSTNPRRSITPTQDVSLTAFFRTGSTPANNPPVASNDSATTNEDTSITIDVLGNDSDPDGDGLSVTSISAPPNGNAAINPDNTVTYTPNPNFSGSDSFTYMISDGRGNVSTATVSITISSVNDPPTTADDSAATDEEIEVTINVLANDSDPDGDALTVASVSSPSNGVVIFDSGTVNHPITYTPNPNFFGVDSFTYTASDRNGGTTTANVSITVNSINDVPVAANDSAVINKDATVTIPVLANDSDPDGDALTVASASSPSNGTAIVNSNDTITYTPNQNFTGTDSFDYFVSDGNGGNDTALIFITVKNSTGATNNKHQVIATVHVKINPKNIDVNPDSDKIYVTHYYSYSEGKVSVIDWKNNAFVTEIPVRYASEYVSVNPDTNKIYITHSGGFNNNIDRVSVIDGITNTVKTVVSIPGTAKRALGEIVTNPITNRIYVAGYHTELLYVINGTNDTVMREIPISGGPNNIGINPVTNMIYTSQYYADTVSVIDGLTNTLTDTIPFNEALRSVAVNEKTNKIYVGGNRTVYVINGATNTIDSSIHVPSSSPWSLGMDANPVTNLIYVADQGGNAIFVINGSTNTVIERVPVGNYPSAITVNHNTNLVYVTNNADSTVSVIDGDIFRTNSTTPNKSPHASDDSVSTSMNESVTIPVLANDTDPDENALTVTSLSPPSNGVASINPNNTITYSPNQNFAGNDSFVYSISDGNGGSDSATVSVLVKQTQSGSNPIDSTWGFLGQNQQNTWYSPQTIINSSNAATLRQVWSITIPTISGTPVISDDMVYATSAPEGQRHGEYAGSIYAMDKTTGSLIWTAGPNAQTGLGFSTIAGIATSNGNVYAATSDSYLVSLNAMTGALNWKVPINSGLEVNPQATYVGPQGTPLVWDGKIIISNVLGNSVARGFVRAFSESDGALLWTFYTVPASPMNNENQAFYQNTWGDCTYCGGGDNWNVPAVDPSTGIIYFGTGNPAPYFNAAERSPNPEHLNLYANSVISLNATNGQMIWYYQQVAGDTHNWDVGMPVQLFNTTINGVQREVVGSGGKNGYYYLLDATTGDLIHATSLGIHLNEDQRPTPEGEITYPGTMGGINTYYTYNPTTNSIYTTVFNLPTEFRSGQIGLDGLGGSDDGVPGVMPNSTLYAVNASTGEINWSVNLRGLAGGASSSNNLVFTADGNGNYYAFDAQSGAVLWNYTSGKSSPFLANWGPPSVTGGLLFETSFTDDGGVMAFAPSNETPQNNPPSASNDFASTTTNNTVTIDVLANDVDPDGDAMTVDSISIQPGNGIAAINQDDTITYTPDQGFAGSDSFGYAISDGMGGTDSATVSVTVNSASGVSTLGHIFVEQTTSQTRTTNTYADISGATISDANLEDGKKYLLVFTAQVSHSDINQNGFIRAVHGSTQFEGSELAFEPTWGGPESRYQYFWFTVWSVAAGEDVKLQFRTEAASGDTMRADQITMTAIKLSDDLTENTDWFFSEQMADAILASSYGTGNSASVTLTSNGSDDWLVLATAQLDPASLAVPQKTRIAASGGVTDTGVEWWQEGEDATNDRMVQTLAKVYKPAATGTTFATNSESQSGTGTRLYNSVFALNLDKMQNHAFQVMPGKITMDTTDNFATSTNVATTTITPSIAGDTWCLGFGVSSSTDQDYARTRMQLDNTDQPNTQTSDFYGTPDSTWDATDKYGYALQTIENLSAVSHTLDVDSTTGFSGVTMEDRLAMCATMDLAP